MSDWCRGGCLRNEGCLRNALDGCLESVLGVSEGFLEGFQEGFQGVRALGRQICKWCHSVANTCNPRNSIISTVSKWDLLSM